MSEDQFRYRVLLVDDLETARDRNSEFIKCGVQFEAIEGVSAYLRKTFSTPNIVDLPVEGRFEHEYDIVLLDYHLEGEMEKYPTGGLVLYPLFVHGFSKKKIGECVVCLYSAVFSKDYRDYSRLFELAEFTRTGQTEVYQKAAFGGFRLGPFFQVRAESILQFLGASAIKEAFDVYDKAGSLEEALGARLEITSAALGANVSLKNLRPDIGNACFFVQNQMPSLKEQERHLNDWLNGMLTRNNYAREAHAVYMYPTCLRNPKDAPRPHVHTWAHNAFADENQNDPRNYWIEKEGYALFLDKKRTLHRAHIEASKGVQGNSHVERCEVDPFVKTII